jgi:hypothetical protein
MEPRKTTPECPVARASRSTTYVRVLHRACVVLGGVEHLAAHLKVGVLAMERWMEGHEEPPEDVFLGAVDIVLLHASVAGRPS